MKKKVLTILLAFCFLLPAPSVSAADAAVKDEIVERSTVYYDALYERDQIASTPKIVARFDAASLQRLPNTPEIECRAAYLADPVSGKVFYEKNAHEVLYPASLTKILTALVVLENCEMDETVTVSQTAVDFVPADYANANLKVGEEFSVYVMLKTMMVQSANEAACALAEHVSGSIEAFAELCNRRAKELGCESVHFTNPNGVHDEKHRCSAYDIYLIAKECRKHSLFNSIVKTTSFTLPATKIWPREDRHLENKNELLQPSSKYYVPACTGIKTGATDPAGECLVSSASDRGLDLICVVMGGKKGKDFNDRFRDSKALLEFVFGSYSNKRIADKSRPVAQIPVENAAEEGALLDVVIRTDITSFVPKGMSADRVKTEIDLPEALEAPIRERQVLGTVTYIVDGMRYSTDLVAARSVDAASGFLSGAWKLLVRLTFEKAAFFVSMAVAAVAAAVLICLLVKKRRAQRSDGTEKQS